MNVLGIETSCDETSAAVVANGRRILSNVVLSQEKLHKPFRGVVPEIAGRAHLQNINWVIQKAIQDSKFKIQNSRNKSAIRNLQPAIEFIDAVAVTIGPGLVGSLLVGKMTAEALGWVWNKPVIGVNHLEAHLFSNLIQTTDLLPPATRISGVRLAPPFLGLIVSGGHTDLVIVKDFGKYQVLGRTRDDAVGECFDKVAKILGLDYPGGPVIDRIAKNGNSNAIHFTRPYLAGTWDFSFSGIKTAVLYYWGKVNGRWQMADGRWQKADSHKPYAISHTMVADVCASFQAAVVDVLVQKTVLAAKKFSIKKIVIGGGVAANSELRERFLREGKINSLQIYFPSKKNCTDNAAMVACAGYFKLRADGKWQMAGSHKPYAISHTLNVDPSLPMANWG